MDHHTLLRLIIESISSDDDESPAAKSMTRRRAEFMRDMIDTQSPEERRISAQMAVRINDRVAGTDEELPADIVAHFRAIAESDPSTAPEPVEVVDPPVNSKWGR